MGKTSEAVKLLLAYDIIPERADEYYEFMLGEMVPRMQVHGVYTIEVWHTAYGSRPERLIGMVAQDQETLEQALATSEWRDLEDRLLAYVTDYERRVVPARTQFQFFNSESTERG